MSCGHLTAAALDRALDGNPDALVAACPECSDALRGYRRLEASLAAAGQGHRAPAGWQDQVMTRVAARLRARRVRQVAVIAIGVAAAAALWLAWPAPDRGAPQIAMVASRGAGSPRDQTIEPGTAAAGDTLRIEASGGPEPRALWVFRNETELVAACPGAAACRVVTDGLAVDVEALRPGVYRALYVTGARQALTPSGALDRDLAEALQAGAQITRAGIEAR